MGQSMDMDIEEISEKKLPESDTDSDETRDNENRTDLNEERSAWISSELSAIQMESPTLSPSKGNKFNLITQNHYSLDSQ